MAASFLPSIPSDNCCIIQPPEGVWRSCHLGQWSTHRTKTAILPAITTHQKHVCFIRSGWAPRKTLLARLEIAKQMPNTMRQIAATKWETKSAPVGMRRMESSVSGHLYHQQQHHKKYKLFVTTMVWWMPRNKTEEKPTWYTRIDEINYQILMHDTFWVTGKWWLWQQHAAALWRNWKQVLGRMQNRQDRWDSEIFG